MNYVKWTQNVIDHIENRIDGCDGEWMVDEHGCVLTYIDIVADELGYPGAEIEKLVYQDMAGGSIGNIYFDGVRQELAECDVDTDGMSDAEVLEMYRGMFVSTVMHLAGLECKIQYGC